VSNSLIASLRASADVHAARCAVESDGAQVNYAELWRRSAAVASLLRRHGVCAGDRVAVLLPNSVEYVAAYYGALMAGAVVVPLNVAAKPRDVATWLSHSGAKFLFATRGSTAVAAVLVQMAEAPLVLAVEDAAEGGDHIAPAAVGPDHPAAILYTSGTTGRPKGVVLSHRNLARNAASIVSYLGLSSGDSIVTVLPFYYSYGNSVLHSHLMAGAKLILEPNFVYPHAVVETLSRRRSTGLAGVPSTFALLLARVNLQSYDLGGLRYVTQAGGAMSAALTRRLRAALPTADIIVMYGQTEATARLTYLPPRDLDRKPGSVGVPIPGVQIQVRREDGRPAAAGEEGEVWARGPNVMLGYWRDPDATREVLREGWLKTGDMGYLDVDGYLFLKGRRTDIIKVGANRIHPAEIEEVVAELQGVQEAAVIGVDDEMLGQVIKVFIVPVPGCSLSPMQVQAHCREHLAAYKIPKHVEFVNSLPRTASGKVRRVALTRGM
jgi:long-chain acyl-CoA synthetase